MKEIINANRGRWKDNLIHITFKPKETEIIYNLPVIRMGAKDKLIWGQAINGKFSVKSSYHLQYTIKRHKNGNLLPHQKVKYNRNRYGGSKVQGKIKRFL